MAAKTKSDIPRFTVAKPNGKSDVLAKLSIPKIPVEAVGNAISTLLSDSARAGIKSRFVRGTLSLY